MVFKCVVRTQKVASRGSLMDDPQARQGACTVAPNQLHFTRGMGQDDTSLDKPPYFVEVC